MPIDFKFTEEQELFRSSLREHLKRTVVPRAKEIMKARLMTPEVHKAYLDQGIFGLLIPEEFGGAAADYITFAIAVEEMTKWDPTGMASAPAWYAAACARVIAAYGSAELKEQILPKVVKEGIFTPLHSTEPGAGTDFSAIAATAKQSDDGFTINGEKICLTGVPETMKYGGGFITSVKTRPELESKGMSLIYIPSTSNGITPSIFTGMGVDIGGVRYDNTKVPDYCLIGYDGLGYQLTYESFVHARVPTTMSIVAAAERALESGMEHLKTRTAFGRPIGGFEGTQFQLADDYAGVEAAKWLCYRAAWVVDEYHKGKVSFNDAMRAGSVAKLVASENCIRAISDVLEWYGGLGTTIDYEIQQAFRSTRQAVIAEGTRNAQRIVIALDLLGREFTPWKDWTAKKAPA